MVQIVGKYQHDRDEGLEEFLVALGTPAEDAKAATKSRSTFELKEAGGSWTFTSSNEGKDSTITFRLGEPYDDVMSNGAVLKSVTVREGDKLVITTEVPERNPSSRVYEFNDAGVVLHLTDEKSGKKAKCIYRRI